MLAPPPGLALGVTGALWDDHVALGRRVVFVRAVRGGELASHAGPGSEEERNKLPRGRGRWGDETCEEEESDVPVLVEAIRMRLPGGCLVCRREGAEAEECVDLTREML